MEPAVHPDVANLAFLLGRWAGEGEGEWPRGEPFRYGEELTFEHVGEPYLLYSQHSWSPDDEGPIHFERGFLRPGAPGRVEMVLAHPLGIAEVAEGTLQDQLIEVATTAVSLTTTASHVTELRRRIEVRDGVLSYELHMAMRDIALTSHVRARLTRASG
jgi:hypothetical protein